MANPQSYFKDIQIVIPRSEIPSWINNQSMGDSMPVDQTPIFQTCLTWVFTNMLVPF